MPRLAILVHLAEHVAVSRCVDEVLAFALDLRFGAGAVVDGEGVVEIGHIVRMIEDWGVAQVALILSEVDGCQRGSSPSFDFAQDEMPLNLIHITPAASPHALCGLWKGGDLSLHLYWLEAQFLVPG